MGMKKSLKIKGGKFERNNFSAISGNLFLLSNIVSLMVRHAILFFFKKRVILPKYHLCSFFFSFTILKNLFSNRISAFSLKVYKIDLFRKVFDRYRF